MRTDWNGKLLISDEGLELVKHFESCFLKAYIDPVGVPTIGFGRIVYPNGKKVKMGEKCTEAQAEEWLLEDLYSEGAKYVRAYLKDEDKLSENEFSALVSFTYNRGAGRFREGPAPYLNAGNKISAMRSLLFYNWAGPKRSVLLGLVRRRHAEKLLFNGGDWTRVDTVEKFKAFKLRGYK